MDHAVVQQHDLTRASGRASLIDLTLARDVDLALALALDLPNEIGSKSKN